MFSINYREKNRYIDNKKQTVFNSLILNIQLQLHAQIHYGHQLHVSLLYSIWYGKWFSSDRMGKCRYQWNEGDWSLFILNNVVIC